MNPQKAAIYHFSDTSGKRPIIYEKEIDALKAFAERQGLEVSEVFFDTSLERGKRKEFDRFLASSDSFDALVTKVNRDTKGAGNGKNLWLLQDQHP